MLFLNFVLHSGNLQMKPRLGLELGQQLHGGFFQLGFLSDPRCPNQLRDDRYRQTSISDWWHGRFWL